MPAAEFVKMVARARSLADVLAAGCPAGARAPEKELIQSRLDRWCEVTGGGDRERFARRLAWDCLNTASVQTLLGGMEQAPETPPRWFVTLEEIIGEARRQPLEPGSRQTGTGGPVPFEDVLLPIVEVGRRGLRNRLGEAHALLSAQAHAALERHLLGRLAQLCAPALQLEFVIFRGIRSRRLEGLLAAGEGGLPTARYRGFVRAMLQGEGLKSFFEEYSVLARLVTTILDTWVDAHAEMVLRLSRDRAVLEEMFLGGSALEQVLDIAPALSDPHDGGHMVAVLTLSPGHRVLYKPKCVGVDAAFQRLLGWINQHGLSLPLRTFRIVERPSYGWVEYIPHKPCQDDAAAGRFFQRAGMLLALLRVLGATDCHAANLIACGEHPVVVDLETLMNPRVITLNPSKRLMEDLPRIREFFRNSVLATSILPQWEFGPGSGIAYDASGLGGGERMETPFRIPHWRNINTDQMVQSVEFAWKPAERNLPMLEGRPVSAHAYTETIIAGFTELYRLIQHHRSELLVPGGPIEELKHQNVRLIFRATNLYGSLLKRTSDPKYLRHGVDRSIELDALASEFVQCLAERPAFWGLVRAEQQALENLDIPLFRLRADSCEIPLPDGSVAKGLIEESAYECARQGVMNTCDEDLRNQVWMIRGAFYASQARHPRGSTPAHTTATAHADSALLVQSALALSRTIRESAMRVGGGTSWMELSYQPQIDRFQFRLLESDLYSGSLGVAVFLAAIWAVTGEAEAREFALKVCEPLRRTVRDAGWGGLEAVTEAYELGISSGLGAYIFSLARIGELLKDEHLLADARTLARLLLPARIQKDARLDVMGGSAGALLALLALHRVSSSNELLVPAIQCGERLVEAQRGVGSGQRAWLTLGEQPLTGFSHGAAGIAYSLLRLYQQVGDRRFLDAALEGIGYERSVFSKEEGNWPDFRNGESVGGKPSFSMVAWCHGASGIGLARLGALGVVDSPEIREDIEAALRATLRAEWGPIDYLCCGNFGRLEFLVEASCRLARADLLESARTAVTRLVSSQEGEGRPRLFSHLPADGNSFGPSLFMGMAGIGYELLRLAEPRRVPSLLLFE